MPIEVGETVNYFSDKILGAQLFGRVLKNPLFAALAITIIIMLIVAWVYRDVDSDESLTMLSARSGFYIFVLLVGALFLHSRVLMDFTAGEKRKDDVNAIFGRGSPIAADEGGYNARMRGDDVYPRGRAPLSNADTDIFEDMVVSR